MNPLMCSASTTKVKEMGEKVIHKYSNVKIGISVFMNDIAVLGDAETIRIDKNAKKLKQKKIQYRLKR